MKKEEIKWKRLHHDEDSKLQINIFLYTYYICKYLIIDLFSIEDFNFH